MDALAPGKTHCACRMATMAQIIFWVLDVLQVNPTYGARTAR
ncbi:MAG: hypothetical protein RLZZ395_2058, partial [Pseudomonadota bacterium]